MFNKRIKIKELLNTAPQGQQVTVMGWVRTFRNNQFVALNDGSTNNNLQVVIELGKYDDAFLKRITTSSSLKVTGTLIESLGKGQKVELKATEVEILGDSDAEAYPLQPKKHSLEFLREKAHLRFRTNTFAAVFRIRHALAFAVHKFFNDKGFVYLHTPIITASDAEGAGETFQVTTLDLVDIPYKSFRIDDIGDKYFKELEKCINELGLSKRIEYINELAGFLDKQLDFEKLVKSRKHEIIFFTHEFKKQKGKYLQLSKEVKELFAEVVKSNKFFKDKTKKERNDVSAYLPEWVVEALNPVRKGISATNREIQSGTWFFNFYNIKFVDNQIRNAADRKVIHADDFFGRSTNLTVSGQLEGELGATALGDIYTFGPTFRAENSNTARHLAEFWMIEPEMAFYDLEDNANLAEEFIKYLIRYAMENNKEDLEFLAQRLADEEKTLPQDKHSEMGLLEKLEFVVNNEFQRLTYTEAIEVLKESNHNKKKKFQYPITGWGMDLQSEHERYLVEKHFKKPVILMNYPAAIKAFYMRQNDGCEAGKETVAAMDILAPGIGEIVGGSQREERQDKLEARMNEMGIPTEELWWYLDTRRFGTVPHAGFGLGFERMVQFVTGMANIRDVIAFPRTPKNAEF